MSKKPLLEDHIFKGKIKEYEQKLIEFYLGIGASKSASEPIQLVLAYLAIHQNLTQKQLKELTGFSSGTISNALKVLTNPRFGIVTREDVPGKQEKLYQMKHISEIFMQGSVMVANLFTELKVWLEKYYDVLKVHKEEKGYKELSGRLHELLSSFKKVLNFSNDIINIFNPDT